MRAGSSSCIGRSSVALQNAEIKSDDVVVCLVTGHGFKDLKATENIIEGNPLKHIVELEELKRNLDESN